MNIARWSKRRLRSVFRRDDVESDLSDEIRLHLEMETEDLVRQGRTLAAARREAGVRLGGVDKTKEDCRDARGTRWLENLTRDLRHGFRGLARTPGYTAVAILSLALGTGANTAIFRLLDAVRLRPLPVANPRQLVEIYIPGGADGFNRRNGATLSYPMWEQVRDHQQIFAGVLAWSPADLNLGSSSQERVHAAYVSGGAFDVLGISAHRGRLLTPADDTPGCTGQVVISDSYWQRRFAGDDRAIGSELTVSGRPVTVAGVTPPGFFGMEVGQTADLMVPVCMMAFDQASRLTARDEFWIWAFARLQPDWSAQRAAGYLQTASAGWIAAVAPTGHSLTQIERFNRFRLTATARPNGVSRLRDSYETSLWLLFGITGLVLAMACANLANLTLARTLSRGKEIATRLAIGASRGRIVFQLFVESLLLAVASTAMGVLLDGFLSGALLAFARQQNNAIQLDLAFDWRALAFVCALAFAMCMVFGLATACYATRGAAVSLAGTSTRGATAGPHPFSFQRLLTAAQISVSLVLVVSSLLLLTSFRNLLTLDAGFRQNGILFSYLDLTRTGRPPGAMPEFKRQFLDAIRSIPGVAGASTTSILPLNDHATTLVVPDPNTGEATLPRFAWVSPQYFATMEIPLLAGRDFNEFDSAHSLRVAIVNELFAKRYFAGRNPLGRSFHTLEEPGYPEAVYQVVGVAAGVRYSSLREAMLPIAYFPDAQEPTGRTQKFLLVASRTSLTATQLGDRLSQNLKTVNSGIVNLGTINFRERVVEGLSRERLVAWLAGFFGALALLLVAIGLFGVVSYMMSARRREIGIRMALGADSGSVIRMVLGQTLCLTLIGCAIGVLAALAVTRVAQGILFEVAPGDPTVFGSSVAVLALVALAAAYLPSRAAARANPVESLHAD
jgi:predicted permease